MTDTHDAFVELVDALRELPETFTDEFRGLSEQSQLQGYRHLAHLLSLGFAAVLFVASSASALVPGDTPPTIDMADQTGQTVDLTSLKGKVVVLDFWASWCGPCRQEMPVLEELHKKYGAQGLAIIGINIDSNSKKMNKFLKGTAVTFRIVHDRKLAVASKYEPATMPSSYLVGRDGKIRYVHEGFRKKDAGELDERIKALLTETTGPD